MGLLSWKAYIEWEHKRFLSAKLHVVELNDAAYSLSHSYQLAIIINNYIHFYQYIVVFIITDFNYYS